MYVNNIPTRDENTRPWYAPFVPPGMKLEGELIFFLLAMLAALFYAIRFFARLLEQTDALYQTAFGERSLISCAVMAPFYQVFDHAWDGYFLVLFCMLGFGICHMLYYRQDAKSIYTMRRLPDRISFIRYTWTLTVCEVMICLLFALGCLLVSFWMYCTVTPPECLPDGQWSLFWENLFTRS